MDIEREYGGADLGDARLSARLIRVVEQLAPDPSASFPTAADTDGQLEATYRFLSNEEVKPSLILAPHVAATVERCVEAGSVVVAHDTTEFEFSGDRKGLGRLSLGRRGFLGHFALAVTHTAARRPLGMLGLQTYARTGPRRNDHHSERRPLEERESIRWHRGVDLVEDAVGGRFSPIHVFDSEADAYELFAHLVGKRRRFVTRLTVDRQLDTASGPLRLSEHLGGLEGQAFRTIPVAARPASQVNKTRKRNPARAAREAQLHWAASSVTFRAPAHAPRTLPATLTLNVVHVYEVNAPEGCAPIDWKLVTSEPIATPEQVEAVIDAYRARWRIEEFFKALKTGCAFEQRQLESLDALLNALAVLTPLAWQLLTLRSMAHDEAEVPASACLRPLQLRILERYKDTKLRPGATVRDAMLAVARLGGHLKRNGDPGWIVLGRGYEKLLSFELGALVILQEM